MLVEKEVIRPGTFWYTDEATGTPRKLVVTPDMCQHWQEQGNAMLSAGLTVPVPFEHDFNAHPMTPADKLLNNSGWVKEYRLHDGKGNPGNRLFSVLDIQDPNVASKLPTTIRWTSPWINSFTDGSGREWKNVISHLALTTRPRIVDQAPFSGIAAALSMATEANLSAVGSKGLCLTIAGQVVRRKADKRVCLRYPVAFSMLNGVALGDGDMPPKKKGKPNSVPDDDDDDGIDEDFEDVDGGDIPSDGDPSNDTTIDLEPFGDPKGDVSMVELLCDLLGALGITVEAGANEEDFKRQLYNAAMTEIHNLTGKAKAGEEQKRTNPPGQPPNNPKPKPGASGQTNPLIQQEQQPMFMSIEEINKIPDPTMKTIALSMYNENVKLRAEVDAGAKTANSLRDAKLKEENAKRESRVAFLSKLSPAVKADLDAMLALPSMALSMGEGGAVVDPMAQTLAVLEKGLSALPRLLTTDASALSVQQHPQDADMLSTEKANELADSMARQMGCQPQAKAG